MHKSTVIASNVMPVILGLDFVLYGPTEDCKNVFPAAYAINLTHKYTFRAKDLLKI
ncbi:MAG: hypothetical protein ACUVXA_20230 [Candidatus Jordarchaeum sp.]|uniref:hypothetical protein n=1 Tax=Candidatus Jordarchaeum sp. TaxID=2823881 RepID=UPI00404A0BA0